MQTWTETVRRSRLPGVLAGAATSLTVALLGRRDTGSAIAPINATSHVLYGDRAAFVERATWRHTLPGYLINTGAAVFWAAVFETIFGAAVRRRGLSAALAGGAATAALAYVTDYHVVPRRLTPGYEHRVSRRSLGVAYGVLALSLGLGAWLAVRRR